MRACRSSRMASRSRAAFRSSNSAACSSANRGWPGEATPSGNSSKEMGFCPLPRPRVIHQHLPHGSRSGRKEVAPVIEPTFVGRDKLQVSFVDERGGVKCVIITLVKSLSMGYMAQLVVDGSQELLRSRIIPRAKRLKGFRYMMLRSRHLKTLRRRVHANVQ